MLGADEEVEQVFVDTESDLSQIIKGKPVTYEQKVILEDVEPGEYVWAIGIVDTTQGNRIGLQIALQGNLTQSGWAKLGKTTVL